MRGESDPQPEMFSYVDLESRIPPSHPIRKIRRIVDAALVELDPAFAEMYWVGVQRWMLGIMGYENVMEIG